MTFYENAAGRIRVNAASFYLHVDWSNNQLPDDSIYELLEQVLLKLQQEQWHKVLFHQHNRGTLSIPVSAWVALDWLPRAVRAGYLYGAFVLSRNMVTRLDTTAAGNDYSKRSPLPVYQYFEQEADAIAWLLDAEKTNPLPKRKRHFSTKAEPKE
ncbi:hypothetical protein MTX78_11200 [Hymenobacter tibetensis]|uniref:STAS/SEC14 domain-containing protein n=1 Tax=Hymenobacter tibetensis TaxID=497967 RepID=A0ABY4D7H7_9BACT|nr:hypothetical protein [Hymenobacter tibetensis]UOG77144.1 hypothetical protein MTX78_11200 [Hymenobacter tibetensis]